MIIYTNKGVQNKNMANYEKRANGGRGYLLKAGVAYVGSAADGNRVMNIDLLDVLDADDENSGTTFSVLEADIDGASTSVLTLMNITGEALPHTITNFTFGNGFTEITANKDIWLNIEING
jgi:hypothetical protein